MNLLQGILRLFLVFTETGIENSWLTTWVVADFAMIVGSILELLPKFFTSSALIVEPKTIKTMVRKVDIMIES